MKLPKIFGKLPKVNIKLKPYLKYSLFGFLGVSAVIICYLTFPYPNVNFDSSKLSIHSSNTDISGQIFGKNFDLRFHKNLKYTDYKQFHIGVDTTLEDGLEDSLKVDINRDYEYLVQRLSFLGPDLISIEKDVIAEEIVITVPAWLDFAEIQPYLSKGKLSVHVEEQDPTAGATTFNLEAPSYVRPIFNSDIQSAQVSTWTYGNNTYDVLLLKFNDPQAMGQKISSENIQKTRWDLDGAMFASATFQSLLEVNGQNPVLAGMQPTWEINTVMLRPMGEPQQYAMIVNNGPLSTSYSLIQESTVPAQSWPTWSLLLITAAAIFIAGIVIIPTSPTLFAIFSLTLVESLLVSSFLIKAFRIQLNPYSSFLVGIPVVIFSVFGIKSVIKMKEKLQEEVDHSTALLSSWNEYYSKMAEMLGIVILVGFVNHELLTMGICGVSLVICSFGIKLSLKSLLKFSVRKTDGKK